MQRWIKVLSVPASLACYIGGTDLESSLDAGVLCMVGGDGTGDLSTASMPTQARTRPDVLLAISG